MRYVMIDAEGVMPATLNGVAGPDDILVLFHVPGTLFNAGFVREVKARKATVETVTVDSRSEIKSGIIDISLRLLATVPKATVGILSKDTGIDKFIRESRLEGRIERIKKVGEAPEWKALPLLDEVDIRMEALIAHLSLWRGQWPTTMQMLRDMISNYYGGEVDVGPIMQKLAGEELYETRYGKRLVFEVPYKRAIKAMREVDIAVHHGLLGTNWRSGFEIGPEAGEDVCARHALARRFRTS